jgi:hypothetical protein
MKIELRLYRGHSHGELLAPHEFVNAHIDHEFLNGLNSVEYLFTLSIALVGIERNAVALVCRGDVAMFV